MDKDDLEMAKYTLQRLLKIKKEPDSYFNLAYCYHLENNLHAALENYNKALELDPNDFNALNNIGIILKDLMQLDDAAKSLLLSLKINPENPIALNNLGITFDLKGDFEAAIELFSKAVELNQNYAEAYLNLANSYDAISLNDKALAAINKAIEASPNYADAHFNKSLILLKSGNFEEGLKEYEWRLKKKEYPTRNYNKPLLDTVNVRGKRILVFDEQGYGDTINFANFIPKLKELGAEVYLECHSSLAELMKGCTGVDKVFERTSDNGPDINYDYQIPLLSLPLFFNSTLCNIPNQVPYVKVESKYNEYWRGWFSEVEKMKVGLVWEGKKPLYNSHRASSLENFGKLTELEDILFVSLQVSEAAKANKKTIENLGIIDLSNEIKNFKDTAAIINNLDLVITVDTSVAHLAGALGKKVWTLLSYKADWRWFKDTDKSPWYPTMKLFRQKKFGDWQELLNRIKNELQLILTHIPD